MDSKHDLRETVTEITSEVHKDDVKRVFSHWQEKYEWVTGDNGELDPN
jgi:hypothetical protein